MKYTRYYATQIVPEFPFYVISDTHFYHDNIVKFSGRDKQIEWLIGPDTAERIDHNEYMVQRWNQVVGQDDRILHLGDLFFWRNNGPEKFEEDILPRLNGDKYLIIGNHDKLKVVEYERMGFKVIEPFTARICNRTVSFDHYPLPWNVNRPGQTHIHGHIHNNGYPIAADWREGSVPTRPGQINVSVEMIDYTPILISDLLS